MTFLTYSSRIPIGSVTEGVAITFFILFFLDANPFTSLVSNFLFNKDFGEDMTIPFDLEDARGSLGSKSVSNDKVASSITQVMEPLMNSILAKDLNLSA